MTDSTLNRFLASGTNAERLAFTPDPPTPASGPMPTYIWFEEDTEDTFAWDFAGSAWVQINAGAGVTYASTAEVRAGTEAAKALSPDNIFDAAAIVALTPGTNVALDMATGFNFSLAMNGDYTLDNPTNTKVGQSGVITCTQDGTGNQTLAFGTSYEFAGGSAFTLSTAAGAKDHIFYYVETSTSIFLTIQKAVA